MTLLSSFSTLSQARYDLVSLAHWIADNRWSPATSTNYSIRLDDTSCAITISGKDKSLLTAGDVMVVDWMGNPLSSGKPSAETLLHTHLYARNRDINVVLHTHSVPATVISQRLIQQKESSELLMHWSVAGYEVQKAFLHIDTHESLLRLPVFPNTQDMMKLSQMVDDYLDQYPQCVGYLIAGHGLYTWGDSVVSCKRHLEALEFLLQCDLLMNN